MEEKQEKTIISIVDEIISISKKHGETVTRTAVNRWSNAVRDRKKLEIEKKNLEKKLQETNAKLNK